MIGEDFFREFFGSPSVYSGSGLAETYGRATIEKALELAKGQPPEANLIPYIQIVMDAQRLGLEVSRPAQRTNVQHTGD